MPSGNLAVFLKRHAEVITPDDPTQWEPGDVIFFVRDGHRHPWHVGIIESSSALYHLYPPRASLGLIGGYGPVHSVWRWTD